MGKRLTIAVLGVVVGGLVGWIIATSLENGHRRPQNSGESQNVHRPGQPREVTRKGNCSSGMSLGTKNDPTVRTDQSDPSDHSVPDAARTCYFALWTS